jgi:hypothetical protein
MCKYIIKNSKAKNIYIFFCSVSIFNYMCKYIIKNSKAKNIEIYRKYINKL